MRLRRLGKLGRVRVGVGGFGGGQVALILHQVDDHIGAVLRAFQAVGRRVFRRRFQQARQHRGLRRGQIIGRCSEIALGGGLEPARTCTQIGAVEVDREDFFLGVFRLHRDGIGDFLQLALHPARAAVGLVIGLGFPLFGIIGHAQTQQFRHLLRDGRTTVALQRATAFGKVDADGRGDAAGRDAEVLVEALVFGRDDGVQQVGRDGVGGDLAAKRLTPPGKHGVVAVKQGDRAFGAAIQQRLDGRKLLVEVEHDARQHHAAHRRDAPERAPDDPPDRPHKPRQDVARARRRRLARGRFLRRRGAAPAGGGGLLRDVSAVCHQRFSALARSRHACLCPFKRFSTLYPVRSGMRSRPSPIRGFLAA